MDTKLYSDTYNLDFHQSFIHAFTYDIHACASFWYLHAHVLLLGHDVWAQPSIDVSHFILTNSKSNLPALTSPSMLQILFAEIKA